MRKFVCVLFVFMLLLATGCHEVKVCAVDGDNQVCETFRSAE